MKIQSTTGPPSTRISATAVNGASSDVKQHSALPSRRSASRPVLCSSRICTMDLEIDCSQALANSSGTAMPRPSNVAIMACEMPFGHELRIAGAGFGDALEGDDHADHGADQAQQRTGRHRESQERLEALEPGHFLEHRLGDAQLHDFGVLLLLDALRFALERGQHAAQRVVRLGRIRELELRAHLAAHLRQIEQLVDGESAARRARRE